jgi:hypothetical protein
LNISEDAVAAMQKLEAHVVADMKKAAKQGLGPAQYAGRKQELSWNVVQKPN